MKKLCFLFITHSFFFYGFQSKCQIDAGDPRSFHFPEGVDFIPNRILIKVKPEYRGNCLDNRITLIPLESVFQSISASSVVKKFPRLVPPGRYEADLYGNPFVDLSLVYQLSMSSEVDMESAINQLLWTGFLEYAEPSYIRKTSFVPSDPDTSADRNYHLKRIKARLRKQ